MGEVTKIDMHVEPPAGPNAPAPADVAKMVDQAKTGVTRVQVEPKAPAPERPQWLPEKFKSPEDMAKAYVELEKKQGSTKPVEKAPPVAEEKPPGEPTKAPKPGDLKLPEEPSKADAEKVVADAGLKMDVLEAEFADKGTLSDESIKALEKAGIPKRVVDGYIAGQIALAERINTELYAVAGGEEKFNEMFQWSQTAESISKADRQAINKAIDSKDPASIKLAFTGVHSKWVAEVGKPPEKQMRGGQGGGNTDVYTSKDALMKDMRNPEYKTNESFRNSVVAKLKRSNIL